MNLYTYTLKGQDPHDYFVVATSSQMVSQIAEDHAKRVSCIVREIRHVSNSVVVAVE